MAQIKVPPQGIKPEQIWIYVQCPNEGCLDANGTRRRIHVHMKKSRAVKNCPFCLKTTALVQIDFTTRRGWLIVTAATIGVGGVDNITPVTVNEEDVDLDPPDDEE